MRVILAATFDDHEGNYCGEIIPDPTLPNGLRIKISSIDLKEAFNLAALEVPWSIASSNMLMTMIKMHFSGAPLSQKLRTKLEALCQKASTDEGRILLSQGGLSNEEILGVIALSKLLAERGFPHLTAPKYIKDAFEFNNSRHGITAEPKVQPIGYVDGKPVHPLQGGAPIDENRRGKERQAESTTETIASDSSTSTNTDLEPNPQVEQQQQQQQEPYQQQQQQQQQAGSDRRREERENRKNKNKAKKEEEKAKRATQQLEAVPTSDTHSVCNPSCRWRRGRSAAGTR